MASIRMVKEAAKGRVRCAAGFASRGFDAPHSMRDQRIEVSQPLARVTFSYQAQPRRKNEIGQTGARNQTKTSVGVTDDLDSSQSWPFSLSTQQSRGLNLSDDCQRIKNHPSWPGHLLFSPHRAPFSPNSPPIPHSSLRTPPPHADAWRVCVGF